MSLGASTSKLARCLGAALMLVLAAAASAQSSGERPPGPTWYIGTLSTTAGEPDPVQVHLTLYDDGFAFARVQLPARGTELIGPGRLRDGVELRLRLWELQPGEDPWWAAELAHLAATSPDAAPEDKLRETVAVLMATRDVDFADEGRRLVGTFRWSTGEPSDLVVTRTSASVRWEFEQGRISSTVVLPYFENRPELNQWFEDDALPAWRSFVDEGRSLATEGVIGWGWYREERLKVAGGAGDLLSVLSTVDTYTGGAHPNSFHHSYLLRSVGRGVVNVPLEELFLGRSRWLPRLSDLVLDGLRRQQAAWVVDGQVASLTEGDLAVFTLTARGITFHFSPYLMGPYVQGTFRVTLPYEDVLDLAAPGGPLAKFAAGAPFVGSLE